MKNLADEQLVRKYLEEKDEHALEFLIKRYLPLTFSFVSRYVGDRDSVSDAVQETFVKIWKNLKKFDQTKSFKTWIFAIAKNTAIDMLKKKNALPFSEMENKIGNFSESLADESTSLFEQLILKESSKKIALAMKELSPRYSTVIKLRINNDLSFAEIAKFLEKPLNTVKSQYSRGMLLLKYIFIKDDF